MAVSISMNIIQNNQSIENNTSNVTVEIYAHWTRGSYNAQTAPDGYPDARGTVSIDDTQYTFYSKFNTGHTTSGSERIFVKTLDIAHDNEGEKVLSSWASYATGVSSGTVSTSSSLALTTIPRKSVVKVADGILGAEQILKVERKSSLLTHTLTYQCGAESGVLCEKTSETDIVWTPPISLAAQYPSAISIPLVFTVITYHEDKEVGSSSVTVTYAIPESVKPAVSLEVIDSMGYFSKYGAYVQKKSRLRIAVTASGNQGSRITAYKIEADGKTYTNSLVITEPVSGSGDLTVKATVTDTRGRTETVNAVIPVMAYTPPNVSTVAADRTDEKGNVSSSGGYLTVRFHAAITALSGKNSAVYTLQYKKANEAYYFSHTLNDYSGRHTVNNGVFTFAAETASSYNIIVTAGDDFESRSKTGVGSSIKKTWSMLKDGGGFAFGKIAEKANTLDMGWNIKLNGNHVLRNGVVAYAPDGFVAAHYACRTNADIEDAINSAYQQTKDCSVSFIEVVVQEKGLILSGGNWIVKLNRADGDNGSLEATSYGKHMERSIIGGIWGKWVDCSPTAFAPAGSCAPAHKHGSAWMYNTGWYQFGTVSAKTETAEMSAAGTIVIGGNYYNQNATTAVVDYISQYDSLSLIPRVCGNTTGPTPKIAARKTDPTTFDLYIYFELGRQNLVSYDVFTQFGEFAESGYQQSSLTDADMTSIAHIYTPQNTRVLQWVNPSPTSTFAEQTLGVGWSGYDIIEIYFKEGNDTGGYTSVVCENGATSQANAIVWAENGAIGGAYRNIELTSSGIYFSSGQIRTSIGHLAQDNRLVPLRIYGIKGAL